MKYGIYQEARNASWNCLIACGVKTLPIKPIKIAKHYNMKCKEAASEKLERCAGRIKKRSF